MRERLQRLKLFLGVVDVGDNDAWMGNGLLRRGARGYAELGVSRSWR